MSKIGPEARKLHPNSEIRRLVLQKPTAEQLAEEERQRGQFPGLGNQQRTTEEWKAWREQQRAGIRRRNEETLARQTRESFLRNLGRPDGQRKGGRYLLDPLADDGR